MVRKMGILQLAAVGALMGASGCVSQSTHDRVLAQLAGTQGDLTRTSQDLATSRLESRRLRGGLSRLAQDCNTTSLRIQSVGDTVASLKSEQRSAADCLMELQRILASQTRTTSGLDQAVSALPGEVADLGKKAATLSEARPTAPPRHAPLK